MAASPDRPASPTGFHFSRSGTADQCPLYPRNQAVQRTRRCAARCQPRTIGQVLLFDVDPNCYLSRRRSQTIATDQIIIILIGALAGGFVNGLTGFGTAITALGLWLYAISPPVAASLVIICSVVSQLQTLPMIWHAIEWRRLLPFVVPGLIGVPIGTLLVSQIDPRLFKIGIGLFLVCYATYALARKVQMRNASAYAGIGDVE